jgi:hypothetical protein
MEDNMTEIEKTKIDILRDALKDASDTTRALDTKINFLVSYNAVFLGVFSTLFLNSKLIIPYIVNANLFFNLLMIIGIAWIIFFINIMMYIAPRSNPIEVFRTEHDKVFSNNVFFIFTEAKTATLELNKLTENYSRIENYKQIEKLLYKEIGKVSYIRDKKIKSIALAVKYSRILTVLFVILLSSFGIVPHVKEIAENKLIHKSTKDNFPKLQIMRKDYNASK